MGQRSAREGKPQGYRHQTEIRGCVLSTRSRPRRSAKKTDNLLARWIWTRMGEQFPPSVASVCPTITERNEQPSDVILGSTSSSANPAGCLHRTGANLCTDEKRRELRTNERTARTEERTNQRTVQLNQYSPLRRPPAPSRVVVSPVGLRLHLKNRCSELIVICAWIATGCCFFSSRPQNVSPKLRPMAPWVSLPHAPHPPSRTRRAHSQRNKPR